MHYTVVVTFKQLELKSAPLTASEAIKFGAQFKQANPASHVRVAVSPIRRTP